MHRRSGATIAKILYTSFGPDYNKQQETIKDNIRMVTTETHVGLDVAGKLFAVCGDNATPNDTLCEEYL
jgi:hypothetical protein